MAAGRSARILAYTDAPSFGGAEQSLGNLLALLDPSLEVSLMVVDRAVGKRIRSRREGVELHVVRPIRNKFDVVAIVEHLRTIRAVRPDIFHANLWTTIGGRYGVVAALLTRNVRTVVVEQSPLETASGLQRLVKRVTSRRLSAHVAVGRRSARGVERSFGLRPESVRTIYNGVPDVELEPLPRLTDGPVVGSLGRLSHEKGYDVAIRALAELPGVSLVLVGDGPERERLQELAAELAVADRLRLVGWSDEPRRYLSTFDVFVLPSRLEGFPLALVEAMLARVPPVAANVGSVDEAVVEGETGHLFPAGEHEALAARLRLVLDDPVRARALGEAARARALELFTAEAMTRSFEELYREILE